MVAVPKTQTAITFASSKAPIKIVHDHPVSQQSQLKVGEALVKLEYTGVCHTDLHAWLGDWPVPPKCNLVGGHEGAGRVVAIGSGTATDLKIGDAVGIKWLATSCLGCEVCREGQEATCAHAQTSGYSVDGTFQQYAVSYTNHLTPIPDALPMEQAAPILCAGVTVWKAIKQSNTKPGDYLLVAGAGGGLGHLAIQYAVAVGLRVIAVDTGADKKKLCLSLGAESFVDFRESKNLVEDIKAVSGGIGPHAALLASSGGAAYNQALEYLRPHGTLVAVGLPPDTVISASVFWTVFRALRIVGSYVGNRQDAIEALDFAARGKVKALISVEPLANLESVYHRMEKGAIPGRIVLSIN